MSDVDENQRGYLEALLMPKEERQSRLTGKQKQRLATWDRRSLAIIRRAVRIVDNYYP